MDKQELQEQFEKGAYLCRVIVEILGAPEKYVVDTMTKIVEMIKENPNITTLQAKMYDPKLEEDEQLYSTFTEMELLFKNISTLTAFCFEVMPSSVEILEPTHLEFTSTDLSTWINELQGHIHDVGRKLKEINAAFKITETNLHHIIRYNILRSCREGKKINDLIEDVGIDEKSLNEFLVRMVERGELQQDGDIYKTGARVVFKNGSDKKEN